MWTNNMMTCGKKSQINKERSFDQNARITPSELGDKLLTKKDNFGKCSILEYIIRSENLEVRAICEQCKPSLVK